MATQLDRSTNGASPPPAPPNNSSAFDTTVSKHIDNVRAKLMDFGFEIKYWHDFPACRPDAGTEAEQKSLFRFQRDTMIDEVRMAQQMIRRLQEVYLEEEGARKAQEKLEDVFAMMGAIGGFGVLTPVKLIAGGREILF